MVGVFSSLIRLWGAFSPFIRFGGSSSYASCSDVASDGSCSSSYDDDINQTQKYHVFLSFRGPDTRKKFTSHLHRALCDKGVETYIDNRLESGDHISPALLKAIESSKIAVIIFSENYASSAWCLDELLHIVNCNLIVVPIFYGVDPSYVRRHNGTYGTALKKLQQRFKPNKLNAWREALEKVANISGYHFDSEKYDTYLYVFFLTSGRGTKFQSGSWIKVMSHGSEWSFLRIGLLFVTMFSQYALFLHLLKLPSIYLLI